MSSTRLRIIAFELDGDLPVAAELVEAVDVERAQVHRQRLIHVVERQAQGLGLGPVDVQEELRRAASGTRWTRWPGRARLSVPGSARRSAACKAARPRPPRSSTMILKPPATPRPGIGDELRTRDHRILDPLGILLPQPGHDVVGVPSSGDACRSSNGSRTMNIEPKLELLACKQKRHSRDGDRVRHARRLRGRSLRPLPWLPGCAAATPSRATGRSDQPALVLLRNEARGGALKDPVRQSQQAAVGQQARPR